MTVLGGIYILSRSWDSRSPVPAVAEKPSDQPASPPAPPVAALNTSCSPSRTAAFYDDFKNPDGGWGQPGAAHYFKDDQTVLWPKVNTSESWIYYPLLFKGATICAEVVSPPEIKDLEEEAAGGVIFWAIDYENYYGADMYTNGTYAIWRRAPGKWVVVAPRAPASSLRSGPNALNQLKVATGNARATLLANGARIIDVWGQPPSRGGAVGLYGQSEKDLTAEWRYSGIAVIEGTETVPSTQELSAPSTVAFLDSCKPNGSAAFFDGFGSPDPGWGAPTETRWFRDGQMALKPPARIRPLRGSFCL